ncbi:hypothetical protein GLAREA_12567 [Glarea lozoyensis ATCC 20868]|uniref:Uncharacterized protein n=1 Tax=Glarea lozoyensis (strain ATCC 20868 / MF5171) TaxID=1116229 RepID=S3D297_GLAL2|nr:uncharacterized protein GLAREA_12567 [Glarea lozoyensis ATCC 20868]EPE31264.1 hypothetical protein GLAREA_12567 [Glarea lozoyensis ATCC 20868]
MLSSRPSTHRMAETRPGLGGGRKRSRTEVEHHRDESPSPLANSKYVLAGGMDTPTIKAARLASFSDHEYGDMAYRRSLGNGGSNLKPSASDLYSEMDASGYFPADGYGRDANGRGRAWQGPGGDGWSRAAIQAVGGVVGKVWEFCKNGGAVFRGFQAGGGKGYALDHKEPTSPYPTEHSKYLQDEKNATWGGIDRESTPLPGRFPEEDFVETYSDLSRPQIDVPPAKRRQVSRNNTQDELTKNWVVVQPTTPTITPSKPRSRPTSRFSQPTASSASRRSTTTAARPASRAGSTLTAPQRPKISRASTVSLMGSPALISNHGASFASPRASPNSKIPRPSPSKSSSAKIPESSASKEAIRWAAVKRKEERDADESIRRLDAQLKAMIREGKEALGTKVEVEMEDDVDLSDGARKWAI